MYRIVHRCINPVLRLVGSSGPRLPTTPGTRRNEGPLCRESEGRRGVSKGSPTQTPWQRRISDRSRGPSKRVSNFSPTPVNPWSVARSTITVRFSSPSKEFRFVGHSRLDPRRTYRNLRGKTSVGGRKVCPKRLLLCTLEDWLTRTYTLGLEVTLENGKFLHLLWVWGRLGTPSGLGEGTQRRLRTPEWQRSDESVGHYGDNSFHSWIDT